MADVLIRGVPDETLRRLKKLAEEHRRSLQQELLAILEQAARLSLAETLARARRIRKRLTATDRSFSDSVPLIREDRAG